MSDAKKSADEPAPAAYDPWASRVAFLPLRKEDEERLRRAGAAKAADKAAQKAERKAKRGGGGAP